MVPSSNSSALRAAGVCAAVTAVTTFLLWWLPRHVPPAPDLVARIALHENPWYLARLWVTFVHNWLALFGYVGAAAVFARRARGFAVGGVTAFGIWAVTELVGTSVILFAVNRTWRAGYATADAAGQASLRTMLAGWDAVWDAMFFLLLVAFFLGTLLYGLAGLRGRGLERVVGALLFAGAPLTACIMAGEYFGVAWASAISDAVYPVLQPVCRFLMGVWLWQAARSPTSTPNDALGERGVIGAGQMLRV